MSGHPAAGRPPRVVIAHDYLTQRGGAERVVLTMLQAFPDATVYTTLYDPEGTFPEFRDARIVTSPLNRHVRPRAIADRRSMVDTTSVRQSPSVSR